MKPLFAPIFLLATIIQLTLPISFGADAALADRGGIKKQVNICIVSGEPLQPGDIVNYVYKVDGQSDRTIRLCCRKCVARFKADPERFLKKLDELETGGKTAEKKKVDR